MKTFVILRQYAPFVGLLPFEPEKTKITIIVRGVSFTCLIYGAITTFWFIISDAESFSELTKAMLSLTIYLYIFAIYFIILWYQKEFLRMFIDLEMKIEERKLIEFYF